jgi:4-amino-4-deoxy-L-arabinose transferase-like glycosyltransferase
MKPQIDINRLLRYLPLLIIVLGIVLRLAVYLQNRNLIIDEANIARNIYERSFIDLLRPLNYEQFAPPVFLWLVKGCSVLFGFSEYALRLYPLLAGLGSLFVLYGLLKEYMPERSSWYALFLFASAYMFLRYATEVKQYSGDILLSLFLMLLALKTDIKAKSGPQFLLIWLFAGSLAIWTSMPSVFILAGAGVYYFLVCIKQREWKGILLLVILAVVWGLQFLFYFNTILKHQSHSSFLQVSHSFYFLYLPPYPPYTWQHNWNVFSALLKMIGDSSTLNYNVAFNTILLSIGVIALLARNTTKGLLILVPVLLVLFAASQRQFTLMPRVALFLVPILLIIIAYGLEQLYRINSMPWKIVLTIVAITYACNGNSIHMLFRPFKQEQLTEGLAYIKAKKIPANDVLFYHSAGPANIYYTEIHPAREQWKEFKNADILHWYDRYDSLGWQIKHVWKMERPVAFIFTNATDAEAATADSRLSKNLHRLEYMDTNYIRVYIYNPR